MKVPFLIAIFVGIAIRLGAGEPAMATATVAAGFVTGITVTFGGSGYRTVPPVVLSGGGGNGATAQAVLSGDEVSAVMVLAAGSGYTSAPTVVIEAPPKALGLTVGLTSELDPKLTLDGPAGSLARVEFAESLTGPWTTWTNVMVSANGVVLVDLSPGSAIRFYRAVAVQDIVEPAGFVWIPPGTFAMGSPKSEVGRDLSEVQHTVTLTQGFWLSDHEVTQGEYEAMAGTNPSGFNGVNLPVDSVSWNEAVAYCQKLTQREQAAGRITAQQAYRLPTEAEWEYAARAGTAGPWYGELDVIAWFGGNADGTTQEVKQKAANAWGLYDMLGNVWEWCSDLGSDYPTFSVTDPTGPSVGGTRVFRGGSWDSDALRARSAIRNGTNPENWSTNLGFRPALSSIR